MKKIVLILSAMLLVSSMASGQDILRRLGERAKNAAENNVGDKIEKKVNDILDGKSKKNKDKNKEAEAEAVEESAEAPVQVTNKTFDINSVKTDFVRGDVVFFNDDIQGEKIGEFPSKWDLINGSEIEVVEVSGEKAIKLKDVDINPLMEEEYYLPEEFTIEFEVLSQPAEEGSGWDATLDLFLDGEGSDKIFKITTSVETHHGAGYEGIAWRWNALNPSGNWMEGEVAYTQIAECLIKDAWNHIAFSFNKRAFKMYLNGVRIVNIPNMDQPRKFHLYGDSDSMKGVLVRNVVMAKGAVELYDRNATDYSSTVEKAMAETGKFVTNNILFETGKATLKPESMEEIEKVADYMKKNPSARFEVQGHTDNQGSDAVNDPLSQKRAEAVVSALEGLGVDPFNLRAVGKGSHEPVADNSTDEGRSKNRRVEFIKR